MHTLNYWLNILTKLQLLCHGKKPLIVVTADGTRLKCSRSWSTNNEVFLEVVPE